MFTCHVMSCNVSPNVSTRFCIRQFCRKLFNFIETFASYFITSKNTKCPIFPEGLTFYITADREGIIGHHVSFRRLRAVYLADLFGREAGGGEQGLAARPARPPRGLVNLTETHTDSSRGEITRDLDIKEDNPSENSLQ